MWFLILVLLIVSVSLTTDADWVTFGVGLLALAMADGLMNFF
jgi:hypothetical protein